MRFPVPPFGLPGQDPTGCNRLKAFRRAHEATDSPRSENSALTCSRDFVIASSQIGKTGKQRAHCSTCPNGLFVMSTPRVAAIPDFHERLRLERQRLGLTQWEFASACELGLRTYARYERGERVPDLNALLGAARAGADVGFLLSGSRNPIQQLEGLEKFADFSLNVLIRQCLGDLDRERLHDDLKALGAEGGAEESRRAKATAALIRSSEALTRAVHDAIAGEGALLAHIGAELADVAAECGAVLTVRQTVDALRLLYRVGATTGGIDRAVILQVVRMTQGEGGGR